MPRPAPSSSGGPEIDRARDRRFLVQLRHRWWMVLLLAALGAFGGALWTYLSPANFLSSAKMVVNGKIIVPGGATYSEELNNFFGTQIALMQSDEVRRRAAQRVATTSPEVAPAPVALSAGRNQETSIFVLSAVGRSPAYTQKLLEAILLEYTDVKKQMRAELSDDELAAITLELKRLDAEISEGQAEMIEFQKNNNVGFLQEQDNSAAEYLVTLNRSLANLKNEYQLLQTLDLDPALDRAQKQRLMLLAQKDRAAAAGTGKTETGTVDEVKKETAAASQVNSDGDIAKAQADLDALVAQRAEFAKDLRPEHPKMVKLDASIADQKRLIDSLQNLGIADLKTRRDALRLEIANLEKTIGEWEVKAVDVGRRMAEYNRLKEKVDRAREVNQQQVINLRNIDLNKNIDQDAVSVLEHASAAVPVAPPLWRNLIMSTGLGLLLGLGAISFYSRFDDRILVVADVETNFNDPLLAHIPNVSATKAGRPVNLLVERDERHGFAEALRALRSSLIFLPLQGAGPRSILITSAVPNEGKSLIASNLAVTFAFAGAKVLLIDGDLRRGALHEQFGLSNENGFADVLESESPGQWRAAVQRTQTRNLSLLSRGRILYHPGEHFLQGATNRLLAELYAEYDYVIIDSAPVMVADDTTSLAPKIDAVLFVIRYGASTIRTSGKALDLLRSRQANVLGIVCNDVGIASEEYYYYRYPQYYGGEAGVRA